ncbi:MAG: hypothetical protein ACPLKS_07430 [Caldisericum exile]|uniref:hypothetical protein n=1 Tax=Caldisericum exile TaxID=693075 RepID=UPI003C734FB7
MLVRIIQSIVNFIVNIVNSILNLLPDSPFRVITDNTVIKQYVAYLNYFVPISFFVQVMLVWLSAISVWYIYRWAMRFAKYID